MDNKTVFERTPKGEKELRSTPATIPENARRILLMVDGVSTFAEISKRVAPSLRYNISGVFAELEKGGFILDKARAANIPKIIVPPKIEKPEEGGFGELDFTSPKPATIRQTTHDAAATDKAEVAANSHALAAIKAKQEAEAIRLKAEQEAARAREQTEALRQKAEQESARIRAELEAARAAAEAEAKARQEAEQRAREEAEAVRRKAEQESARVRAELETARAAAEAEVRAHKEAEQRAREEAEALRRKAEQEAARTRAALEAAKTAQARAQEEAEQRAREEAEAVRLKAEQESVRVRAELEAARAAAEAEARVHKEAEQRARKEAEALRLKAEQEAIRARAELEAAKAAEAKAREEVELRAREEAKTVRQKVEQEAARARAELEAARAGAEADARAHQQAEQRAREESEALRQKAEQEAIRARAELEAAKAAQVRAQEEMELRAREEAERVRQKAEQEAAQARAELEAARAAAEAEARAHKAAEQRAREEAEVLRQKVEQEAARARAELEAARAAAEAEARAHKEAEQRAREEAEALRQKAEQEAAQVRAELEAARAEIEAKAREVAEQRAREAAEAVRQQAEQEAAQVRAELEAARAAAEAEARARKEAEQRARAEAEAVRQKAEQEAARAAAEASARQQAEQRAREEVEALRIKAEQEAARAAAEAEAKVRREAEQRAREEAEALRQNTEQEAARVRAELEAAKAAVEAETKARKELEHRAREEAKTLRMQAEQEAAQVRAELEAAKAAAETEFKARQEAEQRAHDEAEAVRIKAERETARVQAKLEAARKAAEAEAKAHREAELSSKDAAEAVRAELEIAKAAAEAEAKARIEAEQRAREEVEQARMEALREAEHEAARVREEAAQLKAEVDAKYQAEVERLRAQHQAVRARAEAESATGEAAARLKAQQESEAMLLKSAQEVAREPVRQKPAADVTTRSTSATVLFFDVVGYTRLAVNKQIEIKKLFNELVAACLDAQDEGERIILDTGDGAAIGFLQHPEDALETAMKFRKALLDEYRKYSELKVRMGIHLGPINIIKDVIGRSNMIGDGINDAQRVMSFAGPNQIYVSRPYYDFVSRLTDEYAELFRYRGSQMDKHGREHQLYEVADVEERAAAAKLRGNGEAAENIKLEPFTITIPTAAAPASAPEKHEEPEEIELISDIGRLKQPGKISQSAAEQKPPPEAPKPPPPRMPSEEEVARFAAEQSRTWEKAEQRAMASTQAKADQSGSEGSEGAMEKVKDWKHAFAFLNSRQFLRLPRTKVAAVLAVLLLLVVFAIPYLMPTRGYATGIEQWLASRLQQPAQIGDLSIRMLPAPHFDLRNVTLGETGQVQVQSVRINFAWSALFSSGAPVSSVELDGVQVNGAALQQVAGWVGQITSDTARPVARIELRQGVLASDAFRISGIGGGLEFDQDGKFVQAKLGAEENKFELEINAAGNKNIVSVALHGAALPLFPNWVFDELTAKGELTNDGLAISEYFGHILGGIVQGDARVNWNEGWQASGTLTAKAVTLGNLGKSVSGDLTGNANFLMRSDRFPGFAESASLNGSFVATKGEINGIGIIETARLRSRQPIPGGHTHFDEISGALSYAGGVYRFRELRMNAGVLNASGSVDISGQQLSGTIMADLSRSAGMGMVALELEGSTTNPGLRAR